MNKNFIPLVLLVLVGCNYGSSIANDGWGGSPSAGSGGAAGSGSGGGATGGATGSGGDTVGTGGATATGGASTAGTGGGSASTGGASAGGSSGSGGSAQGGSAGADAGRGGDSGADSGRGGSAGASATGGAAGAGTTGGTTAGGAVGSGGAPSTGGANGAGGSTSACVPAATPASLSKVHNPGKDCGACHASKIPTTVGGTVYDKAGTTGISGATVTITGNDGKVLKLVTASNGNFWTKTAVAFPAKIEVSKCPDIAPMVDTVANGNCNSCHRSGGVTTAIHLP